MWAYSVLGYALFFATIAWHEVGHAKACLRCGIRVREICLLGFPLPGIRPIVLPIRWRLFPNTRWTINPLLLGAYMVPDDGDNAAATRKERILVLAFGPIASGIAGLVLLACAAVILVAGQTWSEGWQCWVPSGEGITAGKLPRCSLFTLATALILAAMGLLMFLRRFQWFHFLLLAICVPLTPLAFWLMGDILRTILSGKQDITVAFPGMIGSFFWLDELVRSMTLDGVNQHIAGLAAAALAAGLMSILLGVLNMVPLIAGDGTMIVMELTRPSIGKWLMRITLAMLAAMLTIAVASDVVLLWRLGSRLLGN